MPMNCHRGSAPQSSPGSRPILDLAITAGFPARWALPRDQPRGVDPMTDPNDEYDQLKRRMDDMFFLDPERTIRMVKLAVDGLYSMAGFHTDLDDLPREDTGEGGAFGFTEDGPDPHLP